MALSRYAVIDVYTLEELRRQYLSSDVLGRIQFLAQFRKAGDDPRSGTQALPFDIVFMAAQDDNVEVRQWIARNGCFDMQNSLQKLLQGVPDPIDAIVSHLKSDPDPFVRACLYENQALFGRSDVEGAFGDATHLERLALVRNPAIVGAAKLMQKLFDSENTELVIDVNQRRELALAFISNSEAQRESRCNGGLFDESSDHWSTIWRLAAKWPPGSGVAHYVFENIFTDDSTKEEIYRQCEDASLRATILEGCSSTEILNLGMKDPDGYCRSTAFSKIPRWFYSLDTASFEAKLSSDDKDAFSGMARNESLPVAVLEKIAARLKALGDDWGTDNAKATINRVSQKQTSEEKKPRKLLDAPLSSVVLLLTGIFLMFGAPLGSTLGLGLICFALASVYIQRR